MHGYSARVARVRCANDVVVYRVLAELLLAHVIQFNAVEVGLCEPRQYLNVSTERVVVKESEHTRVTDLEFIYIMYAVNRSNCYI